MPECLKTDPHPNEHGVLLSNRIKDYAYKGMICPFDKDKLKAAGYRLSIGDEYYLGGDRFRLRCDGDTMEIAPYEVAVIKTKEYINMPWFLIGRWNIRVSHAYDGLLWVGAAQVDPGYEGHLSCPIYNLSNKTVRLKRGDNIALIDFVKTTKSNGDEIEPIRHKFGDFGRHLESGLLSNHEQINDLRNRTDAAESRIWTFATMVIAIIGMTVGLTMRFLSSSDSGSDWILPIVFGMSVASVSLSVLWVIGLFFRPLAKTLTKILSLQMLCNAMMYRWLTIIGGIGLSVAFVWIMCWGYTWGINTLREGQSLQQQKYEELTQKHEELIQKVELLDKEVKTGSDD